MTKYLTYILMDNIPKITNIPDIIDYISQDKYCKSTIYSYIAINNTSDFIRNDCIFLSIKTIIKHKLFHLICFHLNLFRYIRDELNFNILIENLYFMHIPDKIYITLCPSCNGDHNRTLVANKTIISSDSRYIDTLNHQIFREKAKRELNMYWFFKGYNQPSSIISILPRDIIILIKKYVD